MTEERDFLSEPARRAEVKRKTDDGPAAGILGLQRAAGNASVSRLLTEDDERSPVKDLLASSAGQPLDRSTQALMQSRLGQDFSDVRVHSDGKATESAKAVNAHAYTVGTDVVFQSDKYAPGTESGKKMLAHELTHVVQQKAGPVDGTPAGGGINISHPSDPFEQAAERNAEQAMSASAAAPQSAVPTQASSLQREGDDEEVQRSAIQHEPAGEDEEVQMSAIQREAAGDKEEEIQASAIQREAAGDEEEEAQASAIQREAASEEEEQEA
jgi:Domain of unknown function (DUF4157)